MLTGEESLTLGPSPRSVLTIGLLAVAVHGGFRLAQLSTWAAALRVCEGLRDSTSDRRVELDPSDNPDREEATISEG